MSAPANPLTQIEDETLLTLPAVFVSHVLTTVGNSGHQVFDGRSTLLAGSIFHTDKTLRQNDSMIVGKTPSVMSFNTLFQYNEAPGFFQDVPIVSRLISDQSPRLR